MGSPNTFGGGTKAGLVFGVGLLALGTGTGAESCAALEGGGVDDEGREVGIESWGFSAVFGGIPPGKGILTGGAEEGVGRETGRVAGTMGTEERVLRSRDLPAAEATRTLIQSDISWSLSVAKKCTLEPG